MFYSDEAVNRLLDYSKLLVNQINQNMPCPKELKEIQYLIFAGLISYYGFERVEEIYKSFQKTKFFYSKESIIDILARKKCTKEQKELERMDFAPKAFFQRKIWMDTRYRYHIDKEIYISDQEQLPFDELLEHITHEVNHIVNFINFPICTRNSKKVLRLGIAIEALDGSYKEACKLEESFNVLQTAEIMEHILYFTQYDVKDLEIKMALDKIKYAYGKKRPGNGYEYTVPIIRPLYEDKNFNVLLKEGRIDGNIKTIRNHFDAKAGVNSFSKLANEVDGIYKSTDPHNFECKIEQATKIVKQYVKK